METEFSKETTLREMVVTLEDLGVNEITRIMPKDEVVVVEWA